MNPWPWSPAIVLAIGAVFTVGIDTQQDAPLTRQLSAAIDTVLADHTGHDLSIPDDELAVAGVTNHLYRLYDNQPASAFSLYIGYYDRQTGQRTIHSPRNCLPGAGWEIRESGVLTVALEDRDVQVNRTIVQKDGAQALVLYWYQGRGRIERDEYAVKWHLLRDAVRWRRTEEALVRIVVPFTGEGAITLASNVARRVIADLDTALPSAPGSD
jgi:EpsI family protein